MTKTAKVTLYEILEVSESASDEVIQMAYKALARKWHPDTQSSNPHAAEDKMKRINHARDILLNPQTRSQYDLKLRNERSFSSQSSYQTEKTQHSQQRSNNQQQANETARESNNTSSQYSSNTSEEPQSNSTNSTINDKPNLAPPSVNVTAEAVLLITIPWIIILIALWLYLA